MGLLRLAMYLTTLAASQVTHEMDFCTQSIDLVDGGGDIPVTGANRQDFVDRYVDFLLNKRVESQFAAFRQGFQRVCDSPVLQMFLPPELEQVVCGVPVRHLIIV